MTAGAPGSAERLRTQIAEVPDQLPRHHPVDDLVERWRSGGVRLAFVELAEQPTINGWWSLIQKSKDTNR